MGGSEPGPPGSGKPTVEYHPRTTGILTDSPERGAGPCQAGSLTGAVASQTVTEAPNGSLSTVGHRAASVKAQGSLTASGTPRAGPKGGLSDPLALSGRASDQRIKATLGITG